MLLLLLNVLYAKLVRTKLVQGPQHLWLVKRAIRDRTKQGRAWLSRLSVLSVMLAHIRLGQE